MTSNQFDEILTSFSKDLCHATKHGELEKIKEIIKNFTSTYSDSNSLSLLLNNTSSTLKRTPIMWACRYSHIEIIKYFLQDNFPIDLHLVDEDEKSSLLFCILNKNFITFSLIYNKIITNSSYSKEITKNGWTPLFYAVNQNFHESLPSLLAVEEIDKVDYCGRTSLMYACIAGNCECVSILLSSGASLEKRSLDGKSPFLFAIKEGKRKVIEIIIKFVQNNKTLNNNSNININNSSISTSTSTSSLSSSSTSLLKILLNQTDRHGRSALHYACEYEYEDILQILLNFSAHPLPLDNNGKSPLNILIHNKNQKCFLLLTKAIRKASAIHSSLNSSVSSLLNSSVSSLLNSSREFIEKGELNDALIDGLKDSISCGNLETVREILLLNSTIITEDLLEYALEKDQVEIYKLLEHQKLSFTSPNSYNFPPPIHFSPTKSISSSSNSILKLSSFSPTKK